MTLRCRILGHKYEKEKGNPLGDFVCKRCGYRVTGVLSTLQYINEAEDERKH